MQKIKKKKLTVDDLPTELLESIFFIVLSFGWAANQTFASALLVNKRWHDVARRLHLTRISLRTERQAKLTIDHILLERQRGTFAQLAPTRNLTVDALWNQPVPKLHELLQLVGQTVATLTIRGNRLSCVLPDPTKLFTATPEPIVSPIGSLPKLTHLEASHINSFDVLTLLRASSLSLITLKLYGSGIVLVPELASRMQPLSLPALRELTIRDVESEWENSRSILCKAAPGLEMLSFCIRPDQFHPATEWLRAVELMALGNISLSVKVDQAEQMESLKEEMQAAQSLAEQRGWTLKILVDAGANSR